MNDNYYLAFEQATNEAHELAEELYSSKGDCGACGFAWIEIKADGRSRLAKDMKAIGFEKSYKPGVLTVWNPSNAGVQSLEIKHRAAFKFAEVFKGLTGLQVDVYSRLD
jgi:hypothetical protein